MNFDKKNINKYKIYKYNRYLAISIVMFILIWLLGVSGVFLNPAIKSGFALVVLVVSVMLHIQNHKSKNKSIPSYFVYSANILSIFGDLMLIFSDHYKNLLRYGIGLSIIVILLQVVAAVISFMIAARLRKETPNLVRDYKNRNSKISEDKYEK